MDENQINSFDDEQESVVEAYVPSEDVEVEVKEPEQIEKKLEISEKPEAAEPEKQKQSAEENAKYAKIRRDAEEKARVKAEDEVIAKLYGESHGIRTMAEYNVAIEAQKEAEQLAELEERGIEPDYIKQLIDSDPDVREARQIKEQRQKEQAENANRIEFLEYFKEANGRDFDTSKDEIPMEAWELTLKGVPLKQAYALTEAKMLRAELNRLKSVQKTETVNRLNSESSTGSIEETPNNTGALTEEMIEHMSPQELMKRWPEVKKLTKMK